MGSRSKPDPRPFTWHPKFTAACEEVPAEMRDEFFMGVIRYGTYGTRPSFTEWGLRAAFASIQEDIDNSINQRTKNKGGRPPKNRASGDGTSPTSAITGDSQSETGVSDEETGVYGTGTEVPDSETQSNPNQSNPSQSKSKRHKFHPPTVDEVKAYCEENGFTHVDPGGFVGYYDSVGWKVGKNRKQMVSWRGACSSWESRERKNHEAKEGIGDEYADL